MHTSISRVVLILDQRILYSMLPAEGFSVSWFQTFAVIWILHIFFWVFPRRQIIVGRRFGTLYHFHLQRLGVQCDTLFSNLGEGGTSVLVFSWGCGLYRTFPKIILLTCFSSDLQYIYFIVKINFKFSLTRSLSTVSEPQGQILMLVST